MQWHPGHQPNFPIQTGFLSSCKIGLIKLGRPALRQTAYGRQAPLAGPVLDPARPGPTDRAARTARTVVPARPPLGGVPDYEITLIEDFPMPCFC